MSNIFKRKGFSNYYCRFQHMGKDYLYSTGTRNRNDALKLLKQNQNVPFSTAYHYYLRGGQAIW